MESCRNLDRDRWEEGGEGERKKEREKERDEREREGARRKVGRASEALQRCSWERLLKPHFMF